jgi:hypothetical protein
MSQDSRPTTLWQRWLRRPQRERLRKILFQVHLWSGITVGLYVLFISVTGSVLVYRNELYVAMTPEPIFSTATTPFKKDDELAEAALRQYPEHQVSRIIRPTDPNLAVEIWLKKNDETKERLFDPRNGEDLGGTGTTGIRLVTGLIKLHKELLAGDTGRMINGLGACAVMLVALTGFVLWWPGINRWRRSMTLHRGVGVRRLIWDLHSMVGIWSVGFILVFSVSGIYLCFPESFHALAERIEPMTTENAGRRLLDRVLYWLAFLHFGRINGIGIPCSGPGLCDQSVKAVWALYGLTPGLMFVTGVTMWWNRVLRRWWKSQPQSR